MADHPVPNAPGWRTILAELAGDRIHGAGAITELASAAVAGAGDDLTPSALRDALARLRVGQPAMASVLRLVGDLGRALEDPASDVRQRAAAWQTELRAARQQLLHQIRNEFQPTGPLAFFSSSSLVDGGIEAFTRHRVDPVQAWVGRSLPGDEGRRTAERLSEAGVTDVHLVDDMHLLDRLANGGIECLVLGCDALAPYRFLNKAGSGGLAAAAKAGGVRVEIWTTTHKFIPDLNLLRYGVGADSPAFGRGSLAHVDLVRCEDGALSAVEAGARAADIQL